VAELKRKARSTVQCRAPTNDEEKGEALKNNEKIMPQIPTMPAMSPKVIANGVSNKPPEGTLESNAGSSSPALYGSYSEGL